MPLRPGGALRAAGVALAALLLAACLPGQRVAPEPAEVDYDIVLDPRAAPVAWDADVRPILEGRCVTCHACYDAPCQLKLSSWEGLVRGANPEKVYDGARIRASAPTRLYVDGRSEADWRARGFHAVTATDTAGDPPPALADSVLYRMLRLKQLNPQPRVGLLPDAVTVDLDRKQTCPADEDFDAFAARNPLWGMPYGMPNLAEPEYRTLVRWLAQGAPPPAQRLASAAAIAQVTRWETFLNGESLRERLMSRYLYEHLFLGHLHFEGAPAREFFRLVRSYTPPGQPIDEVPTVRPFDDPGPRPFWYRLWPDPQSVVAKDHVVYEWSDRRMARYRELFLQPGWEVDALPSYELQRASNPLATFAAIPVASRYRFMLDDARFFIEGFIKGPVCRGQVALNVIDDQFWVFFMSPDRAALPNDDAFVAGMADYLRLPADRGDSLNVLGLWTEYWKGQKAYLLARQAQFERMHAVDMETALGHVWDGDGSNRNAALTIFRHTDSAFVTYGLAGNYPKTAWIIDYPLFERIHYLLVAGFDVWGSVGHQLNTRIVMDFLRMEGESYFLAYMPAGRRKAIRDRWYQGIKAKRAHQFEEPMEWLDVESVIGYRSDDPQREFYQHLERRLGALAGTDRLNRCAAGTGCDAAGTTPRDRVEQALRRITGLRGRQLLPLPDATFLRVRTGADPAADLAYTLIVNKDYSNLTSMLEDEDRRTPDNDTLTVLPGFAASYPNFFLAVAAGDIEAFVAQLAAIRDRDDYERFVALYGVRRTNPDFWAESDWFQAAYLRLEPVEAGIFDLNRYRNR